jgi:excisionase family DNA binding protein
MQSGSQDERSCIAMPLSPTETTSPRRLGTTTQAAKLAGVSHVTIHNWIRQRRIYAERKGTRPYLVDLDDVAAMGVRMEYPRIGDPNDARNAPPLTTAQIHRLRTLLHAAPETATP